MTTEDAPEKMNRLSGDRLPLIPVVDNAGTATAFPRLHLKRTTEAEVDHEEGQINPKPEIPQ